MSRYDGLAEYPDTINGRAVSVVELPDFPTPEMLAGEFLVHDQPAAGRQWDQLASDLGLAEQDYWPLAALNQDACPDPLDIPEMAMLVIPDPDRVSGMADNDQTALPL